MLNLNFSDQRVINQIEDILDEEDECDENEITIFEYRKCCEDFYYNVFLIFGVNFEEEGQKYFFNWLSGLFEGLDIQNESILKNQNDLILVEAIINLIKSIIEAHYTMPCDNLLGFIRFMIDSKVLNSEKILETFLLVINKAISYIGVDIVTFEKVVILMNQIIDVKTLEPVGCFLLMKLSDSLQVPCENYE